MKTLYISIWAVALTLLLYVIEAAAAYKEERLLTRQKGVDMAFIHNWVISFGGLFIWPTINAIVIPEILESHLGVYVFSLILGGSVACALHLGLWPDHEENIGHVLDENYKVTKAGWVNFVFTNFQVAIMFIFLITPMFLGTTLLVSTLFIMFLVVQNAQAYYIQKSFKEWILISELVCVLLITWIKI